MKKIFYSFLVFTAVVAFQACQTDTLLLYEQSPSIYFLKSSFTAGVNSDSTTVPFAFMSGSIQTVELQVMLFTAGKIADYDREVAVVVHDSTTAEQDTHYQILGASVPAKSMIGYVQVRVNRSPDLTAKTEPVLLQLQLLPNHEFNTDFKDEKTNYGRGSIVRDKLTYKIFISDSWVRPSRWSDVSFGDFSVKKFKLLCEICNVSPALLDGQTVDGRTLSTGDPAAFAYIMKLYLIRMKLDGNTVMEEDGVTEMTMGTDV